MEDKIQLKSFKGSNNYLKKLTPVKGTKESSKTFSLQTTTTPRYVFLDDLRVKSLEITNGPILIEKFPINEKYLINNIDYIISYGWVITLKELE